MSINEIYRIVQLVTNKSQMGYISPEDFNLYFNASQTEFLNFLLGELQQYQYGKGQPRVSYSQNATARNRLTCLIAHPSTFTINGSGVAAYPPNFVQVDAMYTISDGRVKFCSQEKKYAYLSSVIDPIAANPIYLLESTGFQFYPTTLGTAKISFIKTPTTVVWAYTLDGDGRPVYNAGSSVNPDWHEQDIFDILARVFKMIGVSLQANEVSQFANELKQNGQ